MGGVAAFVPIFFASYGMMKGWVSPTCGAKLSCLFCCCLMPLGAGFGIVLGFGVFFSIFTTILVKARAPAAPFHAIVSAV